MKSTESIGFSTLSCFPVLESSLGSECKIVDFPSEFLPTRTEHRYIQSPYVSEDSVFIVLELVALSSSLLAIVQALG